MLILTRKVNQRIVIGGSVVLTVSRLDGGFVRLGVEAPPEVLVLREELVRPAADRARKTGTPGRAARPARGPAGRRRDRGAGRRS